MMFIGYTVLSKYEYEEELINDGDIEIFTTKEMLFDVYGEDFPYNEIEYYDFLDISDN